MVSRNWWKEQYLTEYLPGTYSFLNLRYVLYKIINFS